MGVDVKSMALGAVATVVALLLAGVLLMRAGTGNPASTEPRHRSLKLASGRTVEVTSLYLGFGDEHSQRGAADDGLGVKYVTAAAEGEGRDKEAAEVFEAIRPLAESLGLGASAVFAFPSFGRDSRQEAHYYSRESAGVWTATVMDPKGDARPGI